MEENTQISVLRAHCEYYNVPVGDTPEECVKNLSQTARFKEEFAKSRDVEMTLKRMETDRQTNQEVTAFFIRNGSTRYNNDTKAWEQVQGVQLLMPNGRIYTLEGNEITDGKPVETRVTVSGVSVTNHVLTGEKRVSTPKGTTYQVGGDNNIPLPDVTLGHAIERAFRVSKRGTIFGSTGDFPVFGTLTIGTDPGDVSYFGESDYGPETLTVRAYDSDGTGVQTKLNVDTVRQMFYIDADADREEYEAALAGESLIVNGHIGVTFPMEPAKFGATPEEGEQNFNETIKWLDDMGLLGAYESNGNRIQFLDLSKASVGEDGEKPTYVEIDGKRCMNLQQQVDKSTGAIVWQAAVHHEDLQKLPWMSCKSTTWHTKDGEERIWNEGAFFLFPSRAGATTTNTGGLNTGIYAGLNSQVSLGDFSGAAESSTADAAPTKNLLTNEPVEG